MCRPAEASSVGGDVDAAVRGVGGDGHKLVDESCPSHQSEGANQLAMVTDHTQNVAWGHNHRQNEQWQHLNESVASS